MFYLGAPKKSGAPCCSLVILIVNPALPKIQKSLYFIFMDFKYNIQMYLSFPHEVS